MSGYDLIVSFPDGSPSFVHGYEAGELGARIKSGAEAEIEKLTVHAANEEVIRRMCIAWGWECEFADCKDENEKVFETYRVCTLRKVRTAPERTNPHGLRLVSKEARHE